MKYFIDTEFIEGFHKPLFGKRRHFIDLISIGIVREDGAEYYAVSNEYNYNDADQWVKDNVILSAYKNSVSGDLRNTLDANNFHKRIGKSNKAIAIKVLEFFGCYRDQLFWRAPENIEVYGYYADYDWVLFCSLFGRMIDLPKGFPMYCRDLKQVLDEQADGMTEIEITSHVVGEASGWNATGPLPKKLLGITDWSLGQKVELLKTHRKFPKQTNEHNALADAKWNRALYEFLINDSVPR